MGFKIVRNDIVKMNTEAIVNTANQYVDVGPGCDAAIYKAAGYEELLKYRRDYIGEVAEGEVFITPGFNLQSRYIIHAVSPLYIDEADNECEKLHACYRKALQLAKERGVKSIAFPLISTGGFGYPKEEGIRIAVDEIYDFLFENEMDVYLVVYDSKSAMLGKKICPDLEAFIDSNYVSQGLQSRRMSALPLSNLARNDAKGGKPTGREGRSSKRAEILSDEYNVERLSDECEDKFEEECCFCMTADMDLADVDNVEILAAVDNAGVLADVNLTDVDNDGVLADVDLTDVDNVEILEEKLNERVKHMADTFSEYLLYLIESKGMSNVEVYKRSIVDKTTFSKIKNDASYHPQKITALCLCVGARLNLDESRDLLARAGYALSPCDMTDIIFAFFIENEIYDMTELDIQLEEHGVPCIIQ